MQQKISEEVKPLWLSCVLPLLILQFSPQLLIVVLHKYRILQKDIETQYLLPARLLGLDHEWQRRCPVVLNYQCFTFISDFRRIIGHLYNFIVSSQSFFYLFVFRVVYFSSCISWYHFVDSSYSLKLCLYAPKAASCKYSFFFNVHISILNTIRIFTNNRKNIYLSYNK